MGSDEPLSPGQTRENTGIRVERKKCILNVCLSFFSEKDESIIIVEGGDSHVRRKIR